MYRLIAAALVAAAPALAADVYINGTNVEGLTGQRFEKVNVQIDEKGDVYIEAPGYSVQRVTAGPTTPPAPEARITASYFLVTEQTTRGAARYDIEVFINGKLLRKLPNGDGQIVTDITKMLVPGKNQVTFQAHKLGVPEGVEVSTRVEDISRVIIGEGRIDKDKVVIERSMVSFSVSAADSRDIVKQYAFTTH